MRLWLWSLLHPWRRWGPRCGAEPPWRLADARPCIAPRGHEHHDGPSPDWHADGQGYIWDSTRWRWMGEPVKLEQVYADETGAEPPHVSAIFKELRDQ